MLLLAFESSAKAASVALVRDGNLLGEYYQNSGQTHSRTLLKMAEDLLKNCDLSVNQLDAVAVANGPGSFTGLRIGAAAAKGLAWGREIPCIGVSTLEAMAENTHISEGIIVCCMDARRDQVYNAVFEKKNGTLTRLADDRAISVADLEKELKNIEKEKILVGDGAVVCYNTVQDNTSLSLLPEHLRMQRASGVALLAAKMLEKGEYPSAETLSPNYLRLSQAERERNQKLQQEM